MNKITWITNIYQYRWIRLPELDDVILKNLKGKWNKTEYCESTKWEREEREHGNQTCEPTQKRNFTNN